MICECFSSFYVWDAVEYLFSRPSSVSASSQKLGKVLEHRNPPSSHHREQKFHNFLTFSFNLEENSQASCSRFNIFMFSVVLSRLSGGTENQSDRAWNKAAGGGPRDGRVPAQSPPHLHRGHGCPCQSIGFFLLPSSSDPQQTGKQLCFQAANQSGDPQTQQEVPVTGCQKGTWGHISFHFMHKSNHVICYHVTVFIWLRGR